MGDSSTAPTGSGLGHSLLSAQLASRITRHFEAGSVWAAPHRAVEQSLVIGVFGEWGSGKSTLLKHVGEHYARILRGESGPLPVGDVTIAVEFNPWRYEREIELIVPVLHTVEQAVAEARQRYEQVKALDLDAAEQLGAKSKVVGALKDASRFCAIAGLALLSSVKVKGKLPGLGDIEVSPKDGIAEAKSLLDAPFFTSRRTKQRRALLDEMTSIYYDFQRRLSAITGRGPLAKEGAPRLNLLFLVDDLDRCLPEKAVEMLETVKLFLDVPGCAFLLAIDDEVVERGILHRYRDYLFAQGTASPSSGGNHGAGAPMSASGYVDVTRPPITGSEYLEKIIHLPLRLPLPTENELRALLRDRYPELFDIPKEAAPVLDRDPALDSRKGVGLGLRALETASDEGQRLLDLFVSATPPVPRKLIRAVDLFLLNRDVARERGWTQCSPMVLARIVLLQLFAPAMYRYGRREPSFFTTLNAYSKERRDTWDLPSFDILPPKDDVTSVRPDEPGPAPSSTSTKSGDRRVWELIDQPLVRLLKEQSYTRSGFRVQRLFNDRWPLADVDLAGMSRYFSLIEELAPAAAAAPLEGEKRPAAMIDRPDDFVALLTSDRPDAWRSAVEPVAGTWIPDDVLDRLIDRLRPGTNERIDAQQRSVLGSVSWLEMLAEHVSAPQLQRLYRETELLKRLATWSKQ